MVADSFLPVNSFGASLLAAVGTLRFLQVSIVTLEVSSSELS